MMSTASPEPRTSPDALVARMGSLADATRLRLLHVLERHELGVAELVEILQLPQSTVSRHLKALADQGFVRARSLGTTNLYRMGRGELDGAARRLWQLAREESDGWATLEQDRLRLARRLEDRGRRADEFFAGAASRWDRLRAEAYGTTFAEAVLAALIPDAWVVADLGCGTGPLLAALAPFVRGVIGVDRSAAMLKAARRRTAGLDNVELRQGDLEALPLADGECHAALLVLALSYVTEPARVLDEAARAIAPGGRLVVVDLLRHDREDFRHQMGQQFPGFEPQRVEEWMAEAGLEGARCHALPPEPKATGPALFVATARGVAGHAAAEATPASPRTGNRDETTQERKEQRRT